MIRLAATTEKLQAVLGGAVATTQPQAIVCYSDQTASGYSGGVQRTALNSTTDVDILAAPAASTVRDVDYLSIYNRDTASVTVTVKYDVSATDSIIITVTLATLETLVYTHANGWTCLDASGRLKTGAQFSGTLPAANGGTGFSSYTLGDTLYADTSTSLAKLAGNTASSIKVLTQTGTGAVSAAPVWTASTGTGNAVFSASPTFTGTISCVNITPTGLVDISDASAGQIKFPASQNSSADANTLDDYEEGTFTPGVSFGGGSTGITYSAQVGSYTKVGRQVMYGIRVVLTAKGSSTGQALVTGLPFTISNITNGFFGAMFGGSALGAGVNSCQGALNPNTTTLFLQSIAAGVTTVLMDTDFTNNTALNLEGTYPV